MKLTGAGHCWGDLVTAAMCHRHRAASFILKVNLSVCRIKHHAMNVYGEVEASFRTFLTLVLDRDHSGGIMALGSTQPLTEMSTRNIPWGGGGVNAAGA
jgi:hypothetical protein